MRNRKQPGKASRCAYQSSCYLASELKCYGYKIDCILYRKSNGEQLDQARFDQAMDELIITTRRKYQKARL